MTDPVILVELEQSDLATREELAGMQEESAVHAYAHIFTSPFPREETLERWRTYGGNIVVAQLHGEIVGFVAWGDDELYALYVLPRVSG